MGVGGAGLQPDRKLPGVPPAVSCRDHVVLGCKQTCSTAFLLALTLEAWRQDSGSPACRDLCGPKQGWCLRHVHALQGRARFASQGPPDPVSEARAVLQGLKTHMRLLLLEHYRKSGKQKPQALVWYRDGVSEGQFPECSRVEVRGALATPTETLAQVYSSFGVTWSNLWASQGSSAPACSR